MMQPKSVFSRALLLILVIVASSQAQAPRLLNYQGRLEIGGTAAAGAFSMRFCLYSTAVGGAALWCEQRNVTVDSNGVFSVLLGSATPFPATLFSGSGDRYLGITAGNNPEFPDRFLLTSVAYAIRAGEADAVAANGINTTGLADNAVTAPKIAAGQVVKSLNGLKDNVTLAEGRNVKLTTQGSTLTIESTASGVPSLNNISGPVTITGAGGATVTTRRDSIIVSAGATDGRGILGIQNNDNSLTISSPNGPTATISVKDGGVTNAKLADSAVDSTRLASNAVTSTKIAAGAINNSDLANNAVTNTKIATGAVDSTKIAANQVTATKLAANAVLTSKIADGAVTQTKLASSVTLPPGGNAGGDLAGTYPNPTIAANRVDSTRLAANSVTSLKIATGAINNSDLANSAVTNTKLATGAVDSTKIAANQVTATKLAANAVITSKIADGAVTQTKLAPGVTLPISGNASGDLTGTYPAPTIAVNKIDSTRLTSNSVTSAKIAAGAINNSDLANNAVTAPKIASGQVLKSVNGMRDVITISGKGGATVTSSNDTIYVNAGAGGGGTGIQGVQNTDNSLTISNPNGPTATINIKDGGVTSAKIADNTIANLDIAANAAIAESKLALNFPTHSNANDPAAGEKAALAGTNGAPSSANKYVTETDPRNTNARTPSGAASGDLTGNYPGPTIAAGRIDSTRLTSNSVTSAKIAAGAINTSDLADNAVTVQKIATDFVSSINNIKNDGGNIDLIASGNLTITPNNTAKTITFAVSSGGGITQITAGNAIDVANPAGPTSTVSVASNSIDDAEVGDEALTAASLAPNSVTASEIATDAVGSAEIAADAVGSSEIATDAVTDLEIAADAIKSAEIATDAVGSAEIAANAVGNSELAGAAVDSNKIANAMVTSTKIANGGILNGDLADNAVTAQKISPNIVSSVDGVNNDGGNIDLVQGSGISIVPDDVNNTITISATGGGGTITGVTAGNGLSGGGSAGNVTLDVRTGTGISISADSVVINTSFTDGRYVNAGEANSVTSNMIADGMVTGADIANSTIADANISPTSGIQGTKINPNFGSQNVVTTGNVGIGTTSPTVKLHVNGIGSVGDIGPFSGTPRLFVGTNDASTNTVIDVLEIDRGTSGTAADGIGAAILFRNEIDNGAFSPAGRIAAVMPDANLATGDESALAFSTLPSGGSLTERVRIDQSGNVGIGTTAPTARLHISGVAGQDGIRFPDGTLQTSAATGGGGTITGVTAGTGLSGGGASGNVTLNVLGGTGLSVSVDSVALNTGFTDGRYVNASEANSITSSMIVDGAITSADILNGTIVDGDISSSAAIAGSKISPNFGAQNVVTTGSVGIGTTTPGAKLDIAGGNVSLGNNNRIQFKNSGGSLGAEIFSFTDNVLSIDNYVANAPIKIRTGSKDNQVILLDGSGNVGIGTTSPLALLHVNGTAVKPGGGSWGTPSDLRLKKNVRTLQGGLSRMLQLRSVSFEWKEPEKQGHLTGVQTGFIAQEVEKVFPEWVETNSAGYKIVQIRGFEALTVEALRELKAENATLKQTNDSLQARIAAMEKLAADKERGLEQTQSELRALKSQIALLAAAVQKLEVSPATLRESQAKSQAGGER